MSLTACAHCTLPVPQGLVIQGAAAQFCCRGCCGAYALIHTHGLQQYYRLTSERNEPAATGDRRLRYAELDEDAFLAAHTTVHEGGQRSATLGIIGLHCAACIWLLERLPRVVPGVLSARVDWRRATLTVRWATGVVSLAAVADGIAGLGYRPHPMRSDTRQAVQRSADRSRMIDLAVAFAAAGNNMLIAAALYLGMFGSMDDGIVQLLRWASCGVGLVSLAWPGRVFFRGAWSALRARAPHMDLPVATGLLVGGAAGVVNTVRGSGDIYFDTLSMLVFLLLVGRAVQVLQQRRAAAFIDVLFRITPRSAHKRVGEEFLEVPTEVLVPEDFVRVGAGEVVPADGTVVAGQSNVDASVLTGESRAVAVAAGAAVAAGTVNLDAPIEVRVSAVGGETRMGRVLGLVERAAQVRPQIVALADRVGGWFVLGVLAASLSTLVVWLVVAPEVAVDHAVSLLIVACPCALGLATPLTVSVAIGRAARRKILIKGGDVLQRLHRPGTVWLDKTGTVTEGRMTVMSWCALANSSGVCDARVRALVAALEANVSHPVARALSGRHDAADPSEREPPVDGLSVDELCLRTHGGVRGMVAGLRVAVGNAPFMRSHLKRELSAASEAAAAEILRGFGSPVYVAVSGVVVAVVGVGDAVREDSRASIDGLRALGWKVGLLSGDHRDVVAHVGRQLGLPRSMCHGGLRPEDKVAYVSAREPGDGPTMMVGDGVNDSAALAAASVGVATRNGAEASLQAAPVYLGREGLSGVVELLRMGRMTMRAIVRNFAVSLGYNAIAVGLAAFGYINPLLAALLMPLSSLTVVGLALTMRLNGVQR